MTNRERILAVYAGQKPDQVPFMLDLSHWFYHRHRRPWDLSKSYERPEYELIDYHKQMEVGFYMPNLGSFFDISYPNNIKVSAAKSPGGNEITWTLETPLGTISRKRIWEEGTYSWGIKNWPVNTEQQLNVLSCALENRTYTFREDRYKAWMESIGDSGVCYVGTGYSGMGQLLNYWMGIENVMYAVMDMPEVVRETVDRINQNNLKMIDMLADSPVEIITMGDNFSSDVQPPHFYMQWSKPYYDEAIRRLHTAGKYVAVHIDGKLAGAIEMIRDSDADCADAVTPKPMGDLTAQQCRDAAGSDFILSGGVSPDLWLPDVPVELFKKAAMDWLDLKKQSSRLIANAGDQVPPGAAEDRIILMNDLVKCYGKYA